MFLTLNITFMKILIKKANVFETYALLISGNTSAHVIMKHNAEFDVASFTICWDIERKLKYTISLLRPSKVGQSRPFVIRLLKQDEV